MQVNKTSIDTLFTLERRYVIPLFQRPYVWGRERQWEPLWNDIRDMADRAFKALSDERADARAERPHFLGAIVLQSIPVRGSHLPAFEVIDGQQRLTTLQVFLFALRDVVRSRGVVNMDQWVSARTRNANAFQDVEIETHKVWPTQRDVAQFVAVAAAGTREALENRFPTQRGRRKVPRPPLVDAYLYFHSEIDAWFDEKANADNCSAALRQTLSSRLELVQIDLDQNEEPQEIFETLNARGVPLLASDLLRNNIFQRAGGPTKADDLYLRYWKRFEEAVDPAAPEGERFWEVEEGQGRQRRARLDMFVQHYLSVKLSNEVRITALFPEYKAWIEGKSTGSMPFESVDAELADFTRFAGYFRSLIVPEANTTLGPFASRLRALDTSTVYPLLLGLLARSDLSDADRGTIWRDLESFLVRRLICGRSTNSYARLFLQLLRQFENGSDHTAGGFQALLAGGEIASNDWPTDDEFEKGWLTTDAYKTVKPVSMILLALEMASRTAMSESVAVIGPLTIEHVMPQGWNEKEWPLPAGVDPAQAKLAREEVIHDFGNLTLVTGSLNPALSNDAASVKFPKMFAHSNLALNKWFQGRTSWTEEDIRERGKAMFALAKKVWPRP